MQTKTKKKPNKKISILHVVEAFGGGVLSYIENLVNNLPREYSHVIYYSLRDVTPKDYRSKFPRGVKFINWEHAQREINPIKDIRALITLLSFLRNSRNDFDAIVLHSSKAGFLGRLAGLLTGQARKMLYLPHGLAFLQSDFSKAKRTLFKLLEVIGSKLGGTVVAISPSEHVEMTKAGIKNIIDIVTGIRLPDTTPRKRTQKDSTIKVGVLCRASYQKNPELFNDIAVALKDNKQIQFIWIGGGEQEHLLASKNITLTGWVKREEGLERLQSLDIYLSTSRWEGLSVSVLEAMSFEKPLVLSACIGNVDLVKDGYNGYLYNTKEEAVKHISCLAENPTKREVFGQNSKRLVNSTFSLDQMIKRYTAVFNQIVKGHAPS